MLARLVPAFLVRWFARPYIAGQTTQSALDQAQDNLSRGVLSTLDLLGESVQNSEQIENNLKIYSGLVQRLADSPEFSDPHTRPTLSIKPSAFACTPTSDQAAAIRKLAETAHRLGVALTLDMEDHPWTDFTIDLSVELFKQGWDVGTVLQTRLHRTETDLERIPKGMRIRLVIGIYEEPPEIAIQNKREMKQRMLSYAKALLERGVYVEFATHDEPIIRSFIQELAPIYPKQCEVQMLLGVPRSEAQRAILSDRNGPSIPFRLYIPFAIGWDDATAYLRRRMEESPSMIWLVLRNIIGRRRKRNSTALPPTSSI